MEQPKPKFLQRLRSFRLTKKSAIFGAVALVAIAAGITAFVIWHKDEVGTKSGLVIPGGASAEPKHDPELTTSDVVTGYSNIWDMVFVDNNTAVFDERGGMLHAVNLQTKEKWDIGVVPNVRIDGEGGLLGLAKDTDFATNKTMYACYDANGSKKTVRVAKFTMSDDFKSALNFTDIISDIQSQAGRHSGCRMQMDANGNLFVGTGDSAIGTAAQDPKSLAGKVLRVSRDGKGVEGNMAAPFDNRIYNYGHRNIQGLALLRSALPNGAIGLTAEHGTDKEDEINWLMPGNFGWDPSGAKNVYDETQPMTNKTKFPQAIDAIWNSGDPTIAISGIGFLTSSRWSNYQGWLAVSVLKGKEIKLMEIKGDGSVSGQKDIMKDTYGRIRTVTETPSGDLLFSTDNGNNTDKIVRISPK